MSEINQLHTHVNPSLKGMIICAVMIGVGLDLLIPNLTLWLAMFPLLAGIGLLVGGSLTRKTGLLTSGCIMSGLGLAFLVAQAASPSMTTVANKGLLLLVFSSGWLMIPLMTGLVTQKPRWWSVIPGLIMAGIGLLAMNGVSEAAILKSISQYWPAFLVIGGAAVLLRSLRK